MTEFERSLNYIVFLILNWAGQSMVKLSLKIEQMAMARYISGHTQKRFTIWKMDSSIFITIYRTSDNIAHVASVFVPDGKTEQAKNSLALKEGAVILFWEDFATFRANTIRNANTSKAVSL